MRFASDVVKAFKKYAEENLTESELAESRKLLRHRKSRYDQELAESQKKRRDEILLSIVERHRGRSLRLDKEPRQLLESTLARPAAQRPGKL